MQQQELTDKKKAEVSLEDMFSRMSLNKGTPNIPPRKAPGTSGKALGVDTNIYQVQLSDEIYVYRYDVTVTGKTHREREVDLTKRSESSAVIAERVSTCRDAFRAVFKAYRDILGDDLKRVYYDLQSILYTLEPLKVSSTQGCKLTVNNAPPEVILPGNLASITMELKNVKEDAQKIKLSDLSALINKETLDRDRSVLNFIELAISQFTMFNETEFLTLRGSTAFFYDGNKYGLPDMGLDRNETKYLASGVQKSACLIEGFKKEGADPEQRKVGFLLEAKHSPFHNVMSLMSCIEKHPGTESMYADFERGRLNEHSLAQMTRIFKKMQLTVIYPDERKRKIELQSFDKTTANTHTIPDLNVTVAQYFHDKYGQALRYPDAHLICVKQGSNKNYYPSEYLKIADNQIVTAEQMDATSKAAMIRNCTVRPDEMQRKNDLATTAIQLHNSEYTNNAGINFSKKTLGSSSRVLDPPSVQYGDRRPPKRIEAREAAWRMDRFLHPSENQKYAVYLLKNSNPGARSAMSEESLRNFIREIERYSNRIGIGLGSMVDMGEYADNRVEECVRYCSENGIKLCLFITPENIKNCHSVMKMAEHRYNVITQDLEVKTAEKILSGTAAATTGNYLAKTNMKLGGLNYSVQVNDPAIMEELENTIFIGISANQPGSKTMVDRVRTTGDEKPGVLGFAANYGKNYNEYLGDFFYNMAYRPEFYGDLREIAMLCVQRFVLNRGTSPKKVLFYYTGLTEGQFENAYKYAVSLIKDGIKEGNKGVDIPLTLLACQKKHNVRLFPKKYPSNGKDHDFNVPHGTVVDTTIVSPVFSEFYLQAHSALKGTSRIPRYTVIWDDNNYTLDVLEKTTHVLSYEHQIVARATSLPTPIYVAEGYAKRGRDVFNAEYNGHGEELPRDSTGALELRTLSERLNYGRSGLWDKRVNA